MKQTIIFKILLMLSIIVIVVFGVSNYLIFKNNAKLVTDIQAHNMNNILSNIASLESNVIKEDIENVQKYIQGVTRYSSEYLQNFDKEGLKNILEQDKEEGVMLVQVWDNDLDDAFLMLLFKDDKVIFVKKIPKGFEKFEKFKAPITDTVMGANIMIGEVTIYHSNAHAINEVVLLEEKSKQEIFSLNAETNDKLYDFTKNALIIYLMSLVIALMAMAVLLKKLINDPLRKIKLGLDDFFLFIQEKKSTVYPIDVYSKDEFGKIAHSIKKGIELSSRFLEDNRQLNIALKLKTKEERILLDNASQGFLTFDKSFIIDSEYSIKCEEMLGFDIVDKNILNILFLKDKKNIDKNKTILLAALNIPNEIARKSMLTLLPRNVTLNKMYLRLEYKIVEDDKFMLILTNKSEQKELESEIKREQNILKMIITVIKNSDIFYDVKKDFEQFISIKDSYTNDKKKPLDNLNDLYRMIHTFKGLFLQLFMDDTVRELHKVESQLAYFLVDNPEITNEELSRFINSIDFNAFMDTDFDNISKLLGKEFIHNDNSILVDSNIIKDIKKKYTSLLESSSIENKLSKEILDSIIELLQKPLMRQLESYPKLAMQLAQKSGKEIYDFEVVGNKDVIVPENFKPFIKSLVHIFINSIDHGVETAEERMELGKDGIGTIACGFNLDKNNLKIIIADDGGGINVEKIKAKISKDIDISELSDSDIYLYVFQEHMSTKEEITTTSGRGIGMSVVKSKIEELGGDIEVQSELNVGTTFIFNVPLTKKDQSC